MAGLDAPQAVMHVTASETLVDSLRLLHPDYLAMRRALSAAFPNPGSPYSDHLSNLRSPEFV